MNKATLSEREITISLAEDEEQFHVFCAHRGYLNKLNRIVAEGFGKIGRESHGGYFYLIDKRAISLRIPPKPRRMPEGSLRNLKVRSKSLELNRGN